MQLHSASKFSDSKKVSLRGLDVSVRPNEQAELSRLVLWHLEQDEHSSNTVAAYRQFASRKYATPLSEEAHRKELAALDRILELPSPVAPLLIQANTKYLKGKSRGAVESARQLHATISAGAGYFCFPFVAVSLFARLARARRAIRLRKDEALCCVFQSRLQKRLLTAAFSQWTKTLKSDKMFQRRIQKLTFKAWANVAVVQKWSRSAAGQKLERVILRQYRLKRIFDIWRLTTWLAKYLDRYWLTIRNLDYDTKPEEGSSTSSPVAQLPFSFVTTLTRDSMDTIENATRNAFADRFGREGQSGRPLVQNTPQISSSVTNVLPEAVRHVWDMVFNRNTDPQPQDDVCEYKLLHKDGSVGFAGRVTKELSEAQRASKARFQILVPPVWRRWRQYVKTSQKMKAISLVGEKYYRTTTRLKILKSCVQQWHSSQLLAFALTNFAVKRKYAVLCTWRQKTLKRRYEANLDKMADDMYRVKNLKRFTAQWKDSMRSRVIMQVLGTMQALLHRRKMLYVIHMWQANYFSARSAERHQAVASRQAFALAMRDQETSDILRLQTATTIPHSSINSSSLAGDGAYESELADLSYTSAV